ncbi:hypothetical protein BC830DRAFT_768787 [Chytriomyces sp. MP71]|nr:hypothetical protein BC830DRAFT_768787 [Chytriomyces sp. MP71]
MLPVVRAPEQVIYPFDLDCVAVFFDGQQVYATPRSLRALNTRCNFVDTHSLRDRARCVRMLKYATRGFGTLAFEVCRHFPRCDVDANRGLREAIERGFPEKIAEGKKDEFYAHEDEEEEDFDEWELRFRFHPDAGSDAVEPPGELIGMDYTPAPLLYGPAAGPSDLLSQISAFEDPSQFSKLRDRLPLVLRLKYNTTNDPIAFRNEISIPRDNLIPMQFKFIKDSVVGRRVQFATGFHLCYICKKDVELTGEETKSDSSMPEELLASPEARQIVLCESCKDLNAHKRADSVDLVGKHALVTGGRVKIGREVALRLLRNGATVHVTTRFPLLLLHAFRQLEDAGNWWTRLHVYALDLKDLTSVGTLCDHLVATVERLDVFVQNAAQTVRRPAQYYEPIVKAEVELRESMSSNDLDRWIRYGGDNAIQTIGPRLSSQDENMAVSVMSRSHIGNLLDVPSSAMATLVQPADAAILQGPVVDPNWSLQHAPHGDPIDLRLTTSWTQALPHIPLSEMGEVLVINSLAPAMLLQKLQVLLSCMTRPRAHPTFVVNVSSREGNFGASNKNVDGYDDTAGMHPHTNMAKAALNRLTQTIAADWAKEGVYVTAVDPGWVSAMGPGECKRVVPPLTEEDGAARILDPIFTGMNGGALLSGVLLRNFQVSPW